MLTLWGDNASKYDQENFQGKVVAIRSVQVTDWNGKSLSCTFGSTLDIDPDIPEAEILKNYQVSTYMFLMLLINKKCRKFVPFVRMKKSFFSERVKCIFIKVIYKFYCQTSLGQMLWVVGKVISALNSRLVGFEKKVDEHLL